MDDVLTNIRRRRPRFQRRMLDDIGVEMRSRANTMSSAAGAQVDQGFKTLKVIITAVLEVVLRLPGLILLEVLWRYQDASYNKISDEIIANTPFSFLDITTFMEFIRQRNCDRYAAILMSYSTMCLSVLFLGLPLHRLIRIYTHLITISIYGFALKLSTVYITLEVETGEVEIRLDDLIKLERHGFHFLSQILLAMLQSMLLELEGTAFRVSLPFFSIPIIARLCGLKPEKLIVAQNISCMLSLSFCCVYSLYRLPIFMRSTKIVFMQIKAIFVTKGIVMGSVTVWRRFRVADLMTFTWITMFSMRLYVEVFEKGRQWSEAGRILLAGVAESTNTPMTLLALGITVSYICKWVAAGAQLMVGGTSDHGHVLAHAGYTEGFTLFVLCVQTGILGMREEQKAVLLGIVLFIVMSAMFQSIYQLLNPEVLNLAATQSTRSKHIRCLSLTGFLIISPICMAHAFLYVLPVDIWTVIIVGNQILTTVHAISILIKYFINMVESQSEEPWEGSDDLTFYVDVSEVVIELIVSTAVFIFGFVQIVNVGLSFATVTILIFHIIFNIYRKLENLITFVRCRNEAVKNINRLPKATRKQLKERGDLCAICFVNMKEEARITPCNHYFHGPCLRKWLAVKLVCPLCYSDMKEEDIIRNMKANEFVTTSQSTSTLVPNNNNSNLPHIVPRSLNNVNVGPHQMNGQNGNGEGELNRRQINQEVYLDWDDIFNWPNLRMSDRRRMRNRDEQRLHGARDMWPLMVDNEAYESDSSTGTEFTIRTASDN